MRIRNFRNGSGNTTVGPSPKRLKSDMLPFESFFLITFETNCFTASVWPFGINTSGGNDLRMNGCFTWRPHHAILIESHVLLNCHHRAQLGSLSAPKKSLKARCTFGRPLLLGATNALICAGFELIPRLCVTVSVLACLHGIEGVQPAMIAKTRI